MVDPDRICMGCMRELKKGETCPYCGFSIKKYAQCRSSRALPARTILGGLYLIGKVLGEGGFGITYIALDLNRQIPVAVKEYFPSGLSSRDTSGEGTGVVSLPGGDKKQFYKSGLKGFQKEAESLVKLRSLTGIVSVENFFYENNTAYLVMEYINGKTLKQYLQERRTPMGEKETLALMRPILNALEEIHKIGVIHRDISPENIMLVGDGRVYLVDFGAARFSAGEESQNLTVLLKHGYAPVEQYQGNSRQGPWTDIYAVCATMYRMLSGRIPDEAIDRMVGDKMDSLESLAQLERAIQVSRQTSQVIRKGLSVNRSDRYQTVKQLKDDLYKGDEQHEAGESGQNASSPLSIKASSIGENGTMEQTRMAGALILVILFLIMLVLSFLSEDSNTISETEIHPTEYSILSPAKPETERAQPEAADSVAADSSSPIPEPLNSSSEPVAPVLDLISPADIVPGKKIPVSSVNAAVTKGTFEELPSPDQAFDGDKDTSWTGLAGEGGALLWVGFDKAYDVKYLSLCLGGRDNGGLYSDYSRPRKLEITLGSSFFPVELPDSDQDIWMEITPPVRCSVLCIEILETYKGEQWDNICISEISVFGS
ncbi:MAG: serine/threonine-protein kinase [Eubacteriales bacterium]|nr:serine/threonine-protein kinase [Eubacteriales bacterium]